MNLQDGVSVQEGLGTCLVAISSRNSIEKIKLILFAELISLLWRVTNLCLMIHLSQCGLLLIIAIDAETLRLF